MTCSSCRLTWGCQDSVPPAEEEDHPLGFSVGCGHVVVLVSGSGWGSDVDGGGRAVASVAHWGMGCGYV